MRECYVIIKSVLLSVRIILLNDDALTDVDLSAARSAPHGADVAQGSELQHGDSAG